jgi:aminoglycoside 3-N-acetyltransferase
VLSKDDIKSAIQELNIQNESVCIHSSMKSFGCQVDGGAKTIIDSFLSENCTIMVPAFDDDCEIYPPKHLRPEQNAAGDYSYFENCQYGTPKTFTVESNDITTKDMGLIPYTLLRISARKRGYNPLNSMAAVGRYAEELVNGQSAQDVWAPFRKLYEKKGMVLLMGVQLYRATIIHFAEQLAGRVPFVRWANDKNDIPSICNTGGCSHGFENFTDVLKPIEKTIVVGNSLWRCFPAKEMVDICVKAMEENQNISHCHNPNCERCNDAILGGPVWIHNQVL